MPTKPQKTKRLIIKFTVFHIMLCIIAPPSLSPAYSQALSSREEFAVPYVDLLVVDDLNNSSRFGRGDTKLLSFVIYNPDTVAFILRVEFDNGGNMTVDGGGGGGGRRGGRRGRRDSRGGGDDNSGIELGNFRLFYKDRHEVLVEKDISVGWRRGGRVFELEFSDREQDVQERYNMELWSSSNPENVKNARPGVYSETVRFYIDTPEHLKRVISIRRDL